MEFGICENEIWSLTNVVKISLTRKSKPKSKYVTSSRFANSNRKILSPSSLKLILVFLHLILCWRFEFNFFMKTKTAHELYSRALSVLCLQRTSTSWVDGVECAKNGINLQIATYSRNFLEFPFNTLLFAFLCGFLTKQSATHHSVIIECTWRRLFATSLFHFRIICYGAFAKSVSFMCIKNCTVTCHGASMMCGKLWNFSFLWVVWRVMTQIISRLLAKKKLPA